MISRDCRFARPVSSFCPNGQPVFAHWYRFMQALKLHPETTRRYIQQLCKPINGRWWDQWATNVWSGMVSKGLVTKTRTGRTFLYTLTPFGKQVLDEATRKVGVAMNEWKRRKAAAETYRVPKDHVERLRAFADGMNLTPKAAASKKVETDECEYILAR